MRATNTATLLFTLLLALPMLARAGGPLTLRSDQAEFRQPPPPAYYNPASPYDNDAPDYYSPRLIYGTAVETYEGVPPPPVILHGHPPPRYRNTRPHGQAWPHKVPPPPQHHQRHHQHPPYAPHR